MHACRLHVADKSPIGFARLALNVGASDELVLRARVFDTPAGKAFLDSCPHTLSSLQSHGDEMYGTWARALPVSRPQPLIPAGGLAFSDQGQYLCVFYGQTPAWPVEYLGQIDVGWEELLGRNWRSMAVTMEDPLAMESY